jgi:hypothetical protein
MDRKDEMPPKLEPYTPEWERLANQEARYWTPLKSCRDCGGPVHTSYCCRRCGSVNP